MRRRPSLAAVFLLLAVPLLAEVRPSSAPPGAGAVDWEKAYRHNNLGVAHMEQHHYGRAAEEFRRAAEIAPDWAVARVNLGIACFAAHDNEAAEAAFRKALELDPRSPHAHYGLGLLQKVRGERDPAIESFRRVIEIDAEDADARYNLGLLYQWTGQWEESARHLREATALDPTNISAVYKLATALLNSGQAEEGERLMEQFRAMSADPSMGTTRGQQYGEQGRYAEVITEPPSRTAGGQQAPARAPVRFSEAAAAAGLSFAHLGAGGKKADAPAPGSPSERAAFWSDARRAGSGVALGDIDADGDLDLCFAEVGGAGGPALRLFANQGGMKFADRTASAGLPASGTSLGCYLGDIDNDRDLDLLLSGAEGLRIFLNDGQGTFKGSGAAMPKDRAPAAGAAFADVDHDGDLDIFVARPSGPEASPLPIGTGLPGADVVVRLNIGSGIGGDVLTRQALGVRGRLGIGGIFSDLDNDRDVDFVLLDALEPPQLFSNLRGGRWQDVAAERGLGEAARAAAAAVGDYDKDGFMDLALAGATGGLLWRNEAGRRFVPIDAVPAAPQALAPVFLDYDNDGFIDLFVAGGGPRPLQLWRNLGGGRFADASSALPALETPAGLRGAAAGDLDADGDADLVVTRNGGAPLLLRNDGGSARRWLKVRPLGLNSARQGIGVKVEVQAGGLWQKAEVNGGSGYLSQGPAEVLFGLGERPGAEFVRLLWPGGVLQSELEIAAGRAVQVEELDRKGSSCPVLYAWNGRRFEFVADFIGGGGIGFLVAPGRYTRPDPTEYVKISGEQLQARNGALELRVVQQLEEVAYLDRLELVVVDHPADSEIYPDERFKTAPPYPQFGVLEVREKVFPRRALHEGRDRTEALLAVDRVYADDFEPLPWPGYARPHRLTLHFGPEAAGDGWRLFLNGWVDYGYSWANYAAAQAGHALFPPSLERGRPEGAWEKVSDNIGYPAGLARTMVAEPVVGWNGEERRLGIATNMRVAWDQAFLARPRRLDGGSLPRLSAAAAELRFLGYPREYSPDGRRPNLYDYHLAASSFPWKNMRGRFTRYGDVRELLLDSDDRFVIMNRGDEIALRFDARRLPALPSGWRRDYLLFADGYAKDMDPHGAFPDTVEPLPFHAMSAYPYPPPERYPDDATHRDYVQRWNTRVLWED
jgi:Flp pilus assembly protein TadD